MGFRSRWIHLIYKYISSVSYSFMTNRSPTRHITPLCGTRQGDLLSPYLFIMCAKALSAMLQSVERMGEITGVPIARGRVQINHLFFCR